MARSRLARPDCGAREPAAPLRTGGGAARAGSHSVAVAGATIDGLTNRYHARVSSSTSFECLCASRTKRSYRREQWPISPSSRPTISHRRDLEWPLRPPACKCPTAIGTSACSWFTGFGRRWFVENDQPARTGAAFFQPTADSETSVERLLCRHFHSRQPLSFGSRARVSHPKVSCAKETLKRNHSGPAGRQRSCSGSIAQTAVS